MSIPRAENVSRHQFLPRPAKDSETAYSRKEDRMPDLIVALFSNVGCPISDFKRAVSRLFAAGSVPEGQFRLFMMVSGDQKYKIFLPAGLTISSKR